MPFWTNLSLSRVFVAQVSLLGMGFDVLGGCYLAYDLLGGQRGPLRTIARATGYVTLFFIGYFILLGLRYAIIAAAGMGIILAIEFRFACIRLEQNRPYQNTTLLFGFLRGLILGLAGMTIAGPSFGILFGLLSGIGLSTSYAMGFAPLDDYETQSTIHLNRHKIVASFFRALAVSIAGIISGFLLRASEPQWLFMGLKLGLAAGIVSALVSLLSPVIEWRIENLPDQQLGVLGLGLIFIGLLLQSLQYWIVVFNIPVH